MASDTDLLSHFPELRDRTSRVTLLTSEDAPVFPRQDVFFAALHRHLSLRASSLHRSEDQLMRGLGGLGVRPSALPAAVRRLQSRGDLRGFAQICASDVYAHTVGWALQGLVGMLHYVPLLGPAVRQSAMEGRLYSMDLIASVITLLGEKINALPEMERVLFVESPRRGNEGASASSYFTLHEFFQRTGRREINAYSNLLQSLDPESEQVLLLQLERSGYATFSEDRTIVKLHPSNFRNREKVLGKPDLHKLKVRVAVGSLDQHLLQIEEKLTQHRQEALVQKRKGDTPAALQQLKYFKMQETQRDLLMRWRLQLEQAILGLDTASTNMQVIDAIGSATAALKFTREEAQMSPERADDIMLDFEAEFEINDQISQALTSSHSVISEEEEEQLEAELEALMRGDTEQKEASAAARSRLDLPSVAHLSPVQPRPAEATPEEEKEPAQATVLA